MTIYRSRRGGDRGGRRPPAAAGARRRVAVAVPARNEAERVLDCVDALLGQSGRGADLIVVLVNNSTDATAQALTRRFGSAPKVDIRDIELTAPHAHVGWARRLAMDTAAESLEAPHDVLLTTDADTVVASDWIEANLRHIEAGADIVAGAAHLLGHERRRLSAAHQRRLLQAGKYLTALAYLRAKDAPSHDSWPRHDYEGGASIAMTLALYGAIGGLPPLRSGEDRALFDGARKAGAKVRHATDVRVYTSCRLDGRTGAGTAETLRLWGGLHGREPAHGLMRLSEALRPDDSAGARLCFDELASELAKAQATIRRWRPAPLARF